MTRGLNAMKSYALGEARAKLPELVKRALRGEPQRVTRHGKEAVMIVSETQWRDHRRAARTLGGLLARHARAGLMAKPITERIWRERPLGSEFE